MTSLPPPSDLTFGETVAHCYPGWQAMKVALAVWNERISPVFDVSRQVTLFDVEEGLVKARRDVPLGSGNPVQKVEQLASLKVETVICGAISRPLSAMLAAHGIHVIPFVAGGIEDVVLAYLGGFLPSPAWAMPGCGGRRRRFRGGRWQRQWPPGPVGKGGKDSWRVSPSRDAR
jgi:predicted Fe-Mo cluster-binding NifX family protein